MCKLTIFDSCIIEYYSQFILPTYLHISLVIFTWYLWTFNLINSELPTTLIHLTCLSVFTQYSQVAECVYECQCVCVSVCVIVLCIAIRALE